MPGSAVSQKVDPKPTIAEAWETPGAKLPFHLGTWVSSGQCIHVCQDQVPRAVSTKLGLIFPLYDWECAQHVFCVIPGQSVEMEIEGVEAGAQMAALLIIPDERRAITAKVAGEWDHIVCGIGEPKHVVRD